MTTLTVREYLGSKGDIESEDWEEVVVDNPLDENPKYHYELRDVWNPFVLMSIPRWALVRLDFLATGPSL